MNIKVEDKGGEKSEIKVSQSREGGKKPSLTARLSKVEHDLADLKTIVRWAKDHKVEIGEIVEMLTSYDHFVKATSGKIKSNTFGDFEQYIHDTITSDFEQ